jgi:hypothetical protein
MLKTTDATHEAELRSGSRGSPLRNPLVRVGLAVIAVGLLIGLGAVGVRWWTHGRTTPICGPTR